MEMSYSTTFSGIKTMNRPRKQGNNVNVRYISICLLCLVFMMELSKKNSPSPLHRKHFSTALVVFFLLLLQSDSS